MYRHNPQTARLAELVRDGAIGELRVVRSVFSYSLYDAENIRLRTDVDGGSLMDVGCYCISGSRLLAGEPESVHGQAHHRLVGHRLGVHGGDALRRTTSSRCSTAARLFPSGTSSRRSGPRGRSSSTIPGTATSPSSSCVEAATVERIELEPVDSYRLELENLADAIAGDAPLLLGREDALGQARTIEALFRSAESGGTTTLSS